METGMKMTEEARGFPPFPLSTQKGWGTEMLLAGWIVAGG